MPSLLSISISSTCVYGDMLYFIARNYMEHAAASLLVSYRQIRLLWNLCLSSFTLSEFDGIISFLLEL
jgi:hypothetical protein